MRVRNELGWPWKIGIVAGLAALVAGMWWWGYDFGQLFGGFNRSKMTERVEALEADNHKLADEAARARAHFAELESDLAITRGAQTSLSKQASDLAQENAQLKEELAFLQKLVSDSSKQGAMTVQRLTFEQETAGVWRYGILLVRGGNPRDEFAGHVTLQATLAGAPDAPPPAEPVLSLPAAGNAAPLALKFKYYQRVEGTIRVPEGTHVTTLTVRVFEDGSPAPRATRTLTLS